MHLGKFYFNHLGLQFHFVPSLFNMFQPSCSYEVRLKIGEMNRHIERAAPKSRSVVVRIFST